MRFTGVIELDKFARSAMLQRQMVSEMKHLLPIGELTREYGRQVWSTIEVVKYRKAHILELTFLMNLELQGAPGMKASCRSRGVAVERVNGFRLIVIVESVSATSASREVVSKSPS